MSAHDTTNAIRNVLRAMSSAKLLYFYNEPKVDSFGNDVRITWPNQPRGSSFSSNNDFGKFSQYMEILEQNAYSAILSDGSILRASYTFRRDELVGHSLWYWPCPLKIAYEDIVTHGLMELIDLYVTDWRPWIRFRTPLRFDFDNANSGSDHPAVHLHAQDADCRIAVERPLSFSAFVCFIYKNFYYPEWRCQDDLWDNLHDELVEQHKSFLDVEHTRSLHLGWKSI